MTIRDFWRQGAMRGIESAAARRAVAEARQRWLPILEACVERDEDGVDEYVHTEIRRLRRLLGLPAADPLPGMVKRRRQQVREPVRFRGRRCERRGRLRLDKLIARHGPALPLPELRVLLAGDCPHAQSVSIYDNAECTFHSCRRCSAYHPSANKPWRWAHRPLARNELVVEVKHLKLSNDRLRAALDGRTLTEVHENQSAGMAITAMFGGAEGSGADCGGAAAC